MKSKKPGNNTVGVCRLKSQGPAKPGIPIVVILTCMLLVAGCSDTQAVMAVSEPDPDLSFVRSHGFASDPCQLTGETDFTAEFLDDASDIVTCPTGDPAARSLVSDNGAIVVTQTNSFTLYAVHAVDCVVRGHV